MRGGQVESVMSVKAWRQKQEGRGSLAGTPAWALGGRRGRSGSTTCLAEGAGAAAALRAGSEVLRFASRAANRSALERWGSRREGAYVHGCSGVPAQLNPGAV